MHFIDRGTHRLKGKGRRKIFHANGNQAKEELAVFISGKIDLGQKNVKRQEGHHMKWSISQENVTIIVTGTFSMKIKQLFIDPKGDRSYNRVIIENLNTLLFATEKAKNLQGSIGLKLLSKSNGPS